MKNRVFFILFLLVFPFLVYSQIERKVGDFSKVTAYDQITVFLIPSTENKVEISGFNADKVELITENNELKIKFPLADESKGNDILAKVYFVKLISVEANGGSNIGSATTITSPSFDIIGKESSKIKLNLKADKINARLSQGSKLDLLGTTENMDVVASNSSKVFAKDCIVKQANVNVNAGGEIYVNASQVVDAKVRAGGSIFIHGNPKKVNKQLILGGDIIMK
ncbi:head GIN domain-containing protein [Flavobacterium sp. H122]|uniref:head GIN domain-containing protein n=1 Tax=Flavobacterium sp. H122 TaxID=2529860 RepID=UPI0010AA20FA|nr:head GIN domain-containing protein [Flavobacterium sp. H122]